MRSVRQPRTTKIEVRRDESPNAIQRTAFLERRRMVRIWKRLVAHQTALWLALSGVIQKQIYKFGIREFQPGKRARRKKAAT